MNQRVVLWAVVAVWLAVVIGSGRPQLLFAQEGASGVAVAEEEAEAKQTDSIGGMIVSGGMLNIGFFVVLGMFSVWAAAVSLERLFNLRRPKLMPPTFVARLRQLISSGDNIADGFRQLCDGDSSPIARILGAGVVRAGRPVPEVEKAMEDAAAREMAGLRSRTRPLNVVGSVAPLVGLLGTVVGMILAFQISSQEGLGRAERLAEGIYLALMTTAAGLTIAIPCMLLASWFNNRSERFMCEIDETLMDTIPSFADMEEHRLPRTQASEMLVSEATT